MTLPAPSQLTTLSRYTSWYPGQDRVVSEVLSWLASPTRFLCVEAPTGSGKSLISILAAILGQRRTVILTATKGLQSQLKTDFSGHVADIRGQNSYPCILEDEQVTVDLGPCHTPGFECELRDQCYYFSRLKEAKGGDIVSTNYAYWLAQTNYSDGIGPRDLLICDEAHMAFGALESYLSFTILNSDIRRLGALVPDTSEEDFDQEDWQDWALRILAKAHHDVDNLEKQEGSPDRRGLARALKSARSLVNNLDELASSPTPYSWEESYDRFEFVPIWPHHHAQRLFHDTPKVMLMSAVLTDKTADLLGVPAAERRFLHAPSHYPATNTPIWQIPTVRVNRHATDVDMRSWVNRIDQILDKRLDRKGIIFTVSYPRARFVVANSRHQSIMQTHNSKDVFEKVERFKRSPAPAVLVSPTVTSGWDFPGSQCSYIVVGKIPYPDTRPPAIKTRSEEDKEWASFTAMQTLVQEAGRGTRSATDQCEVFIIDDNWGWFFRRNQQFAPQWFKERLKGKVEGIPEPLNVGEAPM